MFYSQFGEDRALTEIFHGKTEGLCVEVGANDGIHGSNSLYFEKLGWQCVLVEPNPALCAEIRSARKATLFEYAASNRRGVITLHVAEGAWRADGMSTVSDDAEVHRKIAAQGFTSRSVEVPMMTLDDILTQAAITRPIDFVSIDVEGFEPQVLEGFTLERWKPVVLIIEDNAEGRDTTIARNLAKRGYLRFKRTGVNDWFAHRTNKTLVNTASRARVGAALTLLSTKAALKRVPALVKLRNALRSRRPTT